MVSTPLSSDRQWRTALGSSLREEHDYRPRVEGALPAGLEGRLFRNGPGCKAHTKTDPHNGDWILDGVARVDMDNGAREEFRFGPRHFVGEPIFAPRGSDEDDGWILTQVHSDEVEKNFLAVFDAGDIAAGPVAMVHLRHHVPLSFHGYWDAGA